MNLLAEKCESIRELIQNSNGKLVDNEIFVILATIKAESVECSTGKLLINLFEKIRKASGIPANLKQPSIRLVPHLDKVPPDTNSFFHIENYAFIKEIPINKLNRMNEIFDDSLRRYNPFGSVDGKLINFYGPKPEIMDFRLEGHEKLHQEILSATKNLINFDIRSAFAFNEFQTIIHAIIYSQNCEKCLSLLFEPLKKDKSVEILVNNLTKGIWSPRSEREMKLGMDWKNSNGKKFPFSCWRLDSNALIPKRIAPSMSSPITQNAPEETEKSIKSQPGWAMKMFPKIIKKLKNDIEKVEKETDFTKMDNCDEEIRKLKELKTSLSRFFLEEKSVKWTKIGKFGFNTGSSSLNTELETIVVQILQNFDKEMSINEMISGLGLDGYQQLQNCPDRVRLENGIINKIHEKIEQVYENLEKPSESSKSSKNAQKPSKPVESPISDSDSENDDVKIKGILEETSSESSNDEDDDDVVLEDEKIEKDEEFNGFGEVVTNKYGEKMLKLNRMEKKELSEVYAYALDNLRGQLKPKLPLYRKSPTDEFCVFDSRFIMEPRPDLSCGYHDVYQQRVNQEIKKFLDTREINSIDLKIFEKLVKFVEKEQNDWEDAAKGIDKKEKLLEIIGVERKKKAEKKKRRSPSPGFDRVIIHNPPPSSPVAKKAKIAENSPLTTGKPRKKSLEIPEEKRKSVAKRQGKVISDVRESSTTSTTSTTSSSSSTKSSKGRRRQKNQKTSIKEKKKDLEDATEIAEPFGQKEIDKTLEMFKMVTAEKVVQLKMAEPETYGREYYYMKALEDVVPFKKLKIKRNTVMIPEEERPPTWKKLSEDLGETSDEKGKKVEDVGPSSVVLVENIEKIRMESEEVVISSGTSSGATTSPDVIHLDSSDEIEDVEEIQKTLEEIEDVVEITRKVQKEYEFSRNLRQIEVDFGESSSSLEILMMDKEAPVVIIDEEKESKKPTSSSNIPLIEEDSSKNEDSSSSLLISTVKNEISGNFVQNFVQNDEEDEILFLEEVPATEAHRRRSTNGIFKNLEENLGNSVEK